MDIEKARKIYTGKKGLPDGKKLPEVEEHFFADNHFVPAFKLNLMDVGRSFYVTKDDRFYFSPDWFSRNVFRIYDCKKIKAVNFVETGASDSALEGALLFGAAGAVVGAGAKSQNYAIRVDMDDAEHPVMFAMISIALKKS